ncbi:MAG: hypothetical protein ABI183_26795 [Polyangiaceae bacterium]
MIAGVAVTTQVDASGDAPPSVVACGGAASSSVDALDDEVGEGDGPDAGGSLLGAADVAASDEQATTTLATDANAIH